MSAGNPIVKVRIPRELVEEIELAIENRNARVRAEPWTFSEFLRVAIDDKLRHMERSRRPKAKKKELQP